MRSRSSGKTFASAKAARSSSDGHLSFILFTSRLYKCTSIDRFNANSCEERSLQRAKRKSPRRKRDLENQIQTFGTPVRPSAPLPSVSISMNLLAAPLKIFPLRWMIPIGRAKLSVKFTAHSVPARTSF